MRNRTLRLLGGLLPAALVLAALVLPGGAAAAVPGGIEGTVTSAGSGSGVGGIEVCAFGVEGTATEEVEECRNTVSPSGDYEIESLPAGQYIVGFLTGSSTYIRQFWQDKRLYSEATVVEVTEGMNTANIDAELQKGATIEGTVTAAATGAPVANVEACAVDGEIEFCVTSNSSGRYAIRGLPGGTWEVSFYPNSGQELVYQRDPNPVNLPAGGTATVNAALFAGGQIAGTVRLAATGAPLAGVRVCLLDAFEIYVYGCLKSPVSGRYRFLGLPEGGYKIAFSPETSELVGTETRPEEAAELAEAPDAYPTQWWNGKPSFATADTIAITPPAIVAGVDGSLGPPPPPVVTPAPVSPAPVVTAPVKKKPVLICHKGFVRRKVKGKLRCVKRAKKHHHRHHRHHRRTRPDAR